MKNYKDFCINDLILLARERDEDAFAELVTRYTPMINKVITPFSGEAVLASELFSEACVALHIAAGRYDIEQQEVTFGLYARICIRNRIVDLIRKSEDDRYISDQDVEQMAYESNVERRLEEREIFDNLLHSAKYLLSDYEYRVLLLHIQGYKTAAIASMLSRSAKSVDNAKARLFRRLREEIGDISDK